ncbi:hypothetical protein B0A55_02861 [Friedmanniomyces simplex]|uniref:Uncharacterized protein n=1 Tax=Friedmanniomyces simplex TaxID=329884 RepID=A0A4U0Y196_9PEZI|nr:hypothetical protein B0A55_02861 [Friedmanniomyces simplex]
MPLLGPTMENRNHVFQTIKPRCIALSQAALALNGPTSKTQPVTERLDQVHASLSGLTANNAYALDPKLADYAFFPISHVLKLSQKLPIRCLELSLQCIAILVRDGWRERIEPQLAAQIIILCTLMAEKKPKGFAFSETTEDLQAAAFWCLHHVFVAAAGSAECKAFLASEANFPQLGQTITVVLDGVHETASFEPQIAATSALQALVNGVAGREVCASFLPGMVSRLTKTLTPSTKQRRNHRVLIGCLSVLSTLLRTTLSDEPAVEAFVKGKKHEKSIITEQWKDTAAIQLKPALVSIMRLQAHDRENVRESLVKLCVVLLKHCRKSLANCSPLALETLLTLSATESESSSRMQLELLLRADPSLSGLLQSTVYDWLQSLPTVMQGADEQAKVRKMGQIRTAYGLLVDSGADTAVIDRMLAGNLRDSVVITLQASSGKIEESSLVSPVQSLDLAVLDEARGSVEFGQPLVKYRGQEEVVSSIEGFARLISKSSSSSAFATDLAWSLRFSKGETQVATFWLLLTVTQTALQHKDTVSDFLTFDDDDHATSYTDHLEDLYAFALTVLSTSSTTDSVEPPDPRLQALALRTLALRAQTAGPGFRPDLIDALYPILHTLATPNPTLQSDSLTTLNILSTACAYPSVRDIIVENVDYLTNAVALKLNTMGFGGVEPQAPQVLLMMVRLAGPGLVPYLEDVVESVFAVLEGWHGYGVLVEMLFGVLGVVAEEGVKAPGLAGGRERLQGVSEEEEGWRAASVDKLAVMLRERRGEEEAVAKEEGESEAHPRQPWGGVEAGDTNANASADDGADDEEALTSQNQPADDDDPPPPAPKTYSLLLKITDLTQHFLPSASPSLRTNLLSLIRTTVPALARHENSFLPLINTLWPEIMSRLDDEEAHVQAAALEIVGVLCEEAGSFMRSRVVQVWPGLREMYGKVRDEIVGTGHVDGQKRKTTTTNTTASDTGRSFERALAHLQSVPEDYTNTATRLQWEALLTCLTTIVSNVPLPPELFDDALEMLGPVLRKKELHEALQGRNGNRDAVWLAMVKMGLVERPAMPVMLTEMEGRGWRVAGLPVVVRGPNDGTSSAMCYHKYTHYNACKAHIPMHTHMCQKNITEDATRVIFCEDYRTVQLRLKQSCPHCRPRSASSELLMSSGGHGGMGGMNGVEYPTPPKTGTP